MRWFGGSAPGGRLTVIPMGARLVWGDPALWVSTDEEQRHVRALERGAARIAVFGPCSASDREVIDALSRPDLASATRSWAGSHTVVRTRVPGSVEVLTDAAGASPLYTVDTPGGVVWGSSSWALSSLSGGRVDTEWLTTFLRDKHATAPDRSAWKGMRPVPAGHLLTLDRASGLSLRSWWSSIRRSPTQASAALRRALGEGVRVRVEGARATTDLAGMDSTTLALLAARHGRVISVTSHPEGVTHGGDLDYARALTHPCVNRMFFPLGARHLPFAPTGVPMPATDEPAPSTAVWSMFSEQLRAMATEGSMCHLTGDGGDNLFLPAPAHLAGLARRGRWLRMLGDAMGWARLRRQSPMPLISAAFRGETVGIGHTPRPQPRWLKPPLPLGGLSAGEGAETVFVGSFRSVARSARADVQLADSLGIRLHNPYFDGAVLDAVVSAPVEQRFSTRRYKPMLADTFADLLPEPHRERATKGLFVGDFHQGVRLNLPHVLDLADGRLAALGVVDPEPLRAVMRGAALGAQTVWPPLLSVLAAEAWLEAVGRASRTEWTERSAPAPEGER